MLLKQCSFLTDENIDPRINAFLESQNILAESVLANFPGEADEILLNYALEKHRVILTHDSDFGKLVFAQGLPFWAVIYLRPGHIDSEVHIQTIRALLTSSIEVNQGFIAVAKNKGKSISLRIRNI